MNNWCEFVKFHAVNKLGVKVAKSSKIIIEIMIEKAYFCLCIVLKLESKWKKYTQKFALFLKRARKDFLIYKLIQVGGYFAYIILVNSSCSSIHSKMLNFSALYTVSFSIIIYVLWLNSTDQVRAPKTLSFKIRLSAQSFL